MVVRGRYSPEVTHGDLEGLDDNDHTQYVNGVTDTPSIDLTLAAQKISGVALPAGIDHGGLAGLADNDHQYILTVTDSGSINFTLAAQNITGVVIPGGVDHGGLAGLSDDDHPQYLLVVNYKLVDGTAQGQVLFWDAAAGKWTYTEVTELFWDDVNKRLGINQNTPTSALDVNETVTVKRLLAGGVTE